PEVDGLSVPGQGRGEASSGTERGRMPSGVPDDGQAGKALPASSSGPREDGSGLVPAVPRHAAAALAAEEDAATVRGVFGGGPKKGRRLTKQSSGPKPKVTPEQRLLLLDTWQRSGLPAKDFASLVGVSKHTLYVWKRRFDEHGPAGLMESLPRVSKRERVPELTRRTILLLKEGHPEYGCQRISELLARGPAIPVSASTVAKVLHEAGYELEETVTTPHPPKAKRFERARPNQLWQTDLFTFVLKRQNRRVYLVAFMDDHSRFLTGFGIHGSASTAMVIDVLRSAIASYQAPEELLTDNGPQYTTWRGKSAFTKECEKLGIRQIVSKPKNPQTLGKIERFWGTLWRELVQTAVFLDLEEARQRLGHFIDHYNFHRPHQGLEGLTPADRFFGATAEVKETMKARVRENALELAKTGQVKEPFYLTGQMGGKPFTLHAQGRRFFLTQEDGRKEEVELVAPEEGAAESLDPDEGVDAYGEGAGPADSTAETGRPEPGDASAPSPGASALDDGLRRLADSLEGGRTTGSTEESPSPEHSRPGKEVES
ncbi:MAG: IS481 family transposase, partial [Elusimicrobiota bacterium]